MPKGGFGNLIALPFQGQAQRNGNTLFVNEQFVPHPDQWAFLFSLPQITPEQLSEYLTAVSGDGDIGVLADDSERTPPWQRKNVRKHLTRSDFPDTAMASLPHFPSPRFFSMNIKIGSFAGLCIT